MKKTLWVVLFFVAMIGPAWFVSEMEKKHVYKKLLSAAEINSPNYPWYTFKNLVTQVADYQEIYDIDSTDWTAHFFLEKSQAKRLAERLPSTDRIPGGYRCVLKSEDWIRHDICNPAKMNEAGFKSFPYDAGGESRVSKLFYLNEENGEAYIIGWPWSNDLH